VAHRGIGACATGELYDVLPDFRVDLDPFDHFSHLDDSFACDNCIGFWHAVLRTGKDLNLLFGRWHSHAHGDHETVFLAVWQREGAVTFRKVLGRNNHER